MSFILDGDVLNAAKADKIPLTGGDDPTLHVAAVDWNQFRTALNDIQAFLRNGAFTLFKAGTPATRAEVIVVTTSPNGSVSKAKGSIALEVTNARVYQNTDGATAWTDISSAPSTPFDTHDIVLTHGAVRDGTVDATSSIQAALNAAKAAVASTGRVQTVKVPDGNFKLLTRVGINQFDLNGADWTKIRIEGEGTGRSRIHQAGNAASANWHMWRFRGGANDIELRGLTLTQQGSSNMPEQSHIIHPGEGCSNLRILDCEIRDVAAGDGIRILGNANGQESVTGIIIRRCKFVDCYRAGVSIQRYTQNYVIAQCDFVNNVSGNQHVDHEPSGGSWTATAGSTGTTLVVLTANFTAMNLYAGMRVYNTTARWFSYIASIDSATQITLEAGVTVTVGDVLQFENRVFNGAIIDCDLRAGTAEILLTLTGDNILVMGNRIQGRIFGLYCNDTTIIGNTINMPNMRGKATSSTVNFVKDNLDLKILNNYIKNDGNNADYGSCIQISHQSGAQPSRVSIKGNTLLLRRKGTGVLSNACKDIDIQHNEIVLHTPGETTESVGIAVAAASGMNVDSAVILHNTIRASAGGFVKGIQVNCTTGNITECTVGGGSIKNATEPLDLPETGGGVFTNPPAIVPYKADAGELTEPPSTKWVQLAGIGGAAPTTNSRKPAIYWGTGTPEGVLSSGVGNLAITRDKDSTPAGNGGATWQKNTATGNTGWKLIAGTTISPSSIGAGPTHNWAPTGVDLAECIRVDTSAAAVVTGLALAAGFATIGREIVLQNISANNLTLNHEDTNSTAANRFTLPAAANLIIGPGDARTLRYDTVSSRWRVAG